MEKKYSFGRFFSRCSEGWEDFDKKFYGKNIVFGYWCEKELIKTGSIVK